VTPAEEIAALQTAHAEALAHLAAAEVARDALIERLAALGAH